MPDKKPMELSLELGEGACRVMVDGLALNITLKAPAGGLPAAAPALLPPVARENGGEIHRLGEELNYYRQISQDIYLELGQLAKKLNLSLQDLTLADVIQSHFDSPGEQLDQARTNLNDVLQMTEKATLNILELVEQIREDCDDARHQLIGLEPGEENREVGLTAGPGPEASAFREDTRASLAQIVAQGQELNRHLQEQCAVKPPGDQKASLHFPLEEILQIVLEFCGNEALKQHLKAVIAKQGEIFRTGEAETAFARLAAEHPVEDGFSQFPVAEVLKILHSTCEDDRFKELFTKILASAGKLFPMPMLPLEGHPVDAAAASATAEKPSFLPLWEGFFQKIQQLAAQADAAPAPPAITETSIEEGKVHKILGVLDRITPALSRIMEALAFQDLTGQRLLQVLKLLHHLQLQILTMVVAAGTKLKKKGEQKAITLEESGILAQDEIDRLLATVTPAASSSSVVPEEAHEEHALDQEAINELLTNMGF